MELEKRLGFVTDGFKRVSEKETAEVGRLRRLYVDKISEAEKLKERVAELVETNCKLEITDQAKRCNKRLRVQGLRIELDKERRRTSHIYETVGSS